MLASNKRKRIIDITHPKTSLIALTFGFLNRIQSANDSHIVKENFHETCYLFPKLTE